MAAFAWGGILLGLLVIFVSVLGIILDCRRSSPLMGHGDHAQCGAFYAVLLLVGLLFCVIGGLLMRASAY